MRKLLTFLCSAVGLAVLLAGAAAVAATQTIEMWDLPYRDMFPAGVALDAQGFVYTAAAGGMDVYRLDPSAGLWRSWGVGLGPEGVLVVDGAVFCTVRTRDAIVYFNPESQGVTTVLPSLPERKGFAELHHGPNMATGEQVFWIAEWEANGVLRYTLDLAANRPLVVGTVRDVQAIVRTQGIIPETQTASYEAFNYDLTAMPAAEPTTPVYDSSAYTEWALPLVDRSIEDIAVAADGTVWISAGLPALFRLDPVGGTLRLMETIQNVAIFQGLLPDPNGSIWFGNILEGAIGHFDPVLGVSETWRIPGVLEVYDLAFDREGRIWFTDRVGDALGRLDRMTGTTMMYRLPAGSEPLFLVVDPVGDVWFSAGSGNYIGRVTPVE